MMMMLLHHHHYPYFWILAVVKIAVVITAVIAILAYSDIAVLVVYIHMSMYVPICMDRHTRSHM